MSLVDYTALRCLRALPTTIQSRILTNSEFQKSVEINGVVAPFNDAGRIRIGDLLDAARQVYETEKADTISNLDGDDVRLELSDRRVVIVGVGDKTRDKTSTPFEIALVSPDAKVRLEAFKSISQRFTVTGPKFSTWEPILKQRQVTNEEVTEIHAAIRWSVPNWWSITQDKISSRSLAPDDLVPNSIEYFVTLCGPLPNGMDVDQYLNGPLLDHRKSLIAENRLEALSLLLPGNLHSNASILPLLSDLADDEVWDVVDRLKDMPDPFSSLCLIEIALARRTTKPEFETFASSQIEKLCGETLPRHDGLDVYEIFPAAVDLSLRHLRRIDGMMNQPPYWHWLCAFTHAGLLTRLLEGLEFDPKEMTEWFATTRHRTDGIADILALRKEPTWRFDLLTRDRIQAEIIGRLMGIARKVEADGRQLPNIALVEKRFDNLMAKGISPFRPGPLEGNLRPMDNKSSQTAQDDVVTDLLTKLKETPGEFPWAGIDNASAVMYLPEEFRAALTEALSSIDLPKGPFIEHTNPLAYAALIASVHKDKNMAFALSDRLLKEFESVKDFEGAEETQSAFLTLLIASTALEDDDWLDWLKEKLYHLAFVAPSGLPVTVLGAHLDELNALLPLSHWKLGRTEALCYSACFSA